ncbi:MAG: hypothetical protein PVJ38_01445 [Candidatus Bathyarchaeota archaeon]
MGLTARRLAWIAMTPFLLLSLFSMVLSFGATDIGQYFEAELEPNETTTFKMEVSIKPSQVSKLDLVFVFDVGESMHWFLDAIKEQGTDISKIVEASAGNPALGVAWFSDYPGRYSYAGYSESYGGKNDSPWGLLQGITEGTGLLESSLRELPYLEGGDRAQSVTRALYETRFLGWRDGAKRMVIIFGDSPLHDTDFYGSIEGSEVDGFGGDPGRDGVAGTEDDLDFESVVSELEGEGIIVSAIHCQDFVSTVTHDFLALESYEYMAVETGGMVTEVWDSTEIPGAVEEALEGRSGEVQTVTLEVPEEYGDLVYWSPASHESVEENQTVSFDVSVTAPMVTKTEEIEIPLTVKGDHESMGTTYISITVKPGAGSHDHIHHESYADPRDLAVSTTIATAGSIGASAAVGGAENFLEVGRMQEGIRLGKGKRIPFLKQIRTLVVGVLLIGVMYAIASSGIPTLVTTLELPWELPYLGSSLPVYAITNFNVGAFISALPVILLSSTIVFVWRYGLEIVGSRMLGIKAALKGTVIGTLSLIGTTALNYPYGFPMVSVYQANATKRDKGYMALIKNLGLLSLLLPLYLIERHQLLGGNSWTVYSTATLITVMTYFYTSLPYKGEGIHLYRWSRVLDLGLIISGLVLYFSYKAGALPEIVIPGVGAAAALLTLLTFIDVMRKRRELRVDRQLTLSS